MTNSAQFPSRRDLFRLSAGSAAAAAIHRLGVTSAFAQSVPDYKALVCVFLAGGHDGHNMIVPQSQVSYDAYMKIRKGLVLPDGNTKLHQITTKGGTPYAFNDGLAALGPFWLPLWPMSACWCNPPHARNIWLSLCRCRPICFRTPTRSFKCRPATPMARVERDGRVARLMRFKR